MSENKFVIKYNESPKTGDETWRGFQLYANSEFLKRTYGVHPLFCIVVLAYDESSTLAIDDFRQFVYSDFYLKDIGDFMLSNVLSFMKGKGVYSDVQCIRFSKDFGTDKLSKYFDAETVKFEVLSSKVPPADETLQFKQVDDVDELAEFKLKVDEYKNDEYLFYLVPENKTAIEQFGKDNVMALMRGKYEKTVLSLYNYEEFVPSDYVSSSTLIFLVNKYFKPIQTIMFNGAQQLRY